MDIFNYLIEQRKQRKIKQENLAIFLKVTKVTISRYENKKRDMPYRLMVKYAEFLGYELKLQVK